jgi:enamine deaminase RidA (YjgF/YER057c/UK114 family)
MNHFGAIARKPPASLIGVAELAFPGLLIEIETVAVD